MTSEQPKNNDQYEANNASHKRPRVTPKFKKYGVSLFLILILGVILPIVIINNYKFFDENPVLQLLVSPKLLTVLAGLTGFSFALLSYLQAEKPSSTTISDMPYNLAQEDIDKIMSGLEKRLIDKSSESIIWTIYRTTEDKLKRFSEVNIAGGIFEETRKRLNQEIFALQRRGNLNLILGIIITFLGLYILYTYLLPLDEKEFTNAKFIQVFLPRLSLVILIEIFAYFFLRLYKSSLQEIKFYQNELTNVEAKLSALQLAFSDNKTQEKITVIEQLLKTERNPTPAVTQASAEAEKAHVQTETTLEIIKTMSEVFKNKS